MRGGLPPKPTGYDPEARYHQQTHEKTHGAENKLRNSATVKVHETSKGIFLEANGRAGMPSVIIPLCDPNTGSVKYYRVFAVEVAAPT